MDFDYDPLYHYGNHFLPGDSKPLIEGFVGNITYLDEYPFGALCILVHEPQLLKIIFAIHNSRF